MKKKVVAIIVIVIFASGCTIIACALSKPKAIQYMAKLNGEELQSKMSIIKVKNKYYVSVDSMNDLLSDKILCKEDEKAVEILTSDDKEPAIKITTSISEQTAINIADAVIGQRRGQDYFQYTQVSVEVVDEGKNYSVWRYEKGAFGGDYAVIIRMADGKVLSVTPGE